MSKPEYWQDLELISECEAECRLPDGSACQGASSDCTPKNCSVVERMCRLYGYLPEQASQI
jgi:hypothetical protein